MSLIAAWDYSGSGPTIPDVSGNGRSFTLTGTSARTAAGGGYTYGGTQPTKRGLFQASAEIQLGPAITGMNTPARTIMTHQKGVPANPSWFLESFRASGVDTGVLGWLLLSGVFRGRTKDPSNTVFEVNTTTDAVNFHHRALTYDGAAFRLYHDAVLIGSVPMAGGIWAADAFRVFDGCGPNVVLSDTRIFDTALDATDIGIWMNTPVGVVTLALSTATEVDDAEQMAWSKDPVIPVAGELDTPHSMGWSKSGPLSSASEADTPNPMDWSKSDLLPSASEVDTPHLMDWSKSGLMSSAGETDTPYPLEWSKPSLLQAATEIDVAHAMSWTKRLVFRTATETDTARRMNFGEPFFPVTDPEARIRANPADTSLRANVADATLRPNQAEATI